MNTETADQSGSLVLYDIFPYNANWIPLSLTFHISYHQWVELNCRTYVYNQSGGIGDRRLFVYNLTNTDIVNREFVLIYC